MSRLDSILRSERTMPVIKRVFTSLGTIQVIQCPASEVVQQPALTSCLSEFDEGDLIYLVTFTLVESCDWLVVTTSSNAVFVDHKPTLAILTTHVGALDVKMPSFWTLSIIAAPRHSDIFWIGLPMEVAIRCAVEQAFDGRGFEVVNLVCIHGFDVLHQGINYFLLFCSRCSHICFSICCAPTMR